MLRLAVLAEDWYCHKLRLPFRRRLCDRFEAWVTGGADGPEG
jgi:hypothetical protein